MKPGRGIVTASLGMAAILAMGLSIRNGFVYDDWPAIVRNTRVTDPSLWHTIPTSPYWLGTLWRPFTVAMLALEWRIGDGKPWIFHVVSLVAYFGVGTLLFGLLRRLAISAVAALAAAVLFLLHPVHVEVVANVVGQAELWTALSLLAATIVYVRARQHGVTVVAIAAVLALAALGIVSKEQGFVAPIILVGVEWLLLGDGSDRIAARLRLLAPVIALCMLLFIWRASILDSFTGESPAVALRGLSAGGRLLTFLAVVPEYARLLLWPLHLQADYGPPGIPIGGPITLRHCLGLAIVVAVAVGIWKTRRSNPVAAFGLWWAAATLAPVSNLLTPSGVVMAERLMFLPTIGFAMALAATLAAIEKETASKPRWVGAAYAVLAIWGGLLLVRSITRVPTWSTQQRFFTDLTVDAPVAYRAWKVAGEYWDETNDRSRAIADLRHSLQLWPHDYEVNERLGQYLRTEGRCDAAVPVLASGVELNPDATSLRAKLIECLIAERDLDAADRYVSSGLARGQSEFESERVRIVRLRTSAGFNPP